MPAGAPPKYKTAKQLQDAVDDYFKNGITKRKIIVGKGESAVEIEIPVPTITGLVLHLGFADRCSFYDLEKQEKFSYTIKRARTFIEKEYEEQLATKGNAGAIFALKNFGWKDQQQRELSGPGGRPIENKWTVEIVDEGSSAKNTTPQETKTNINH